MPYTNLDYLKDFTGDDPDLIKEAVQRFLKNSPVLLNQLNEGFEEEDWNKVSFSAHTLYSATQIMGIQEIKDELKEVENIARENPDADTLKENVDKINKAMKGAYKELQSYK